MYRRLRLEGRHVCEIGRHEARLEGHWDNDELVSEYTELLKRHLEANERRIAEILTEIEALSAD
jgi:hypothetical protein